MALIPVLQKRKDGGKPSARPTMSNLPDQFIWCAKGNHNLIPVFQVGSYSCSTIVRWCTCCGAVVVDMDADGRTRPGYFRELQAPDLANRLAGK